VWQRAVDLAAEIDPLIEIFIVRVATPWRISSWRAALSVSSNIAEGNGRAHRMEYAHHMSIARGSLLEVESVLYVAIRCRHLDAQVCARALELVDAISRMLTNLLRALYASSRAPQPDTRAAR
jgi:four helix bundle protein